MVPAGAGPKGRYGVDLVGHFIGGPLVVDPPAGEVRPGLGRVTRPPTVHKPIGGDGRRYPPWRSGPTFPADHPWRWRLRIVARGDTAQAIPEISLRCSVPHTA